MELPLIGRQERGSSCMTYFNLWSSVIEDEEKIVVGKIVALRGRGGGVTHNTSQRENHYYLSMPIIRTQPTIIGNTLKHFHWISLKSKINKENYKRTYKFSH